MSYFDQMSEGQRAHDLGQAHQHSQLCHPGVLGHLQVQICSKTKSEFHHVLKKAHNFVVRALKQFLKLDLNRGSVGLS